MDISAELSRTTTILVNNIHCASCVSYIQDVFASFGPAVQRVEVSVLSHEVRISHESSLSASEICHALLGAAFEVCSATTVDAAGAKIHESSFTKDGDGWLERALNRLTSDSETPLFSQFKCLQFSDKNLQRSHLATCAACREENFPEKDLSLSSTKSITKSLGMDTYNRMQGGKMHRIAARQCKSDQAELCLPSNYDGSFLIEVSHGSEQSLSYQHDLILHIDGMSCEGDRLLLTHALENLPSVQSVNVCLETSQVTLKCVGYKELPDEIVEFVGETGFEASIARHSYSVAKPQEHQILGSQPSSPYLEAVLLIGGMTCAACTGAVSSGLSGLPFVENVNVTLLTNTAVVKFAGEENLPSIIQAVEDLGFECSLERCSFADVPTAGAVDIAGPQERTITLRIEGMFCKYCPTRVLDAIQLKYSDRVNVKKSPSLSDPTMNITYTPLPPDFTIRDIVSVVNSLNDLFSTKVHHPVSAEQRAQQMKMREQRRLLRRLLLCSVTAIPTFLIGVLWMSLVPSSDNIRMFFEQSIGLGRGTRSDWALFALATPVMFFAADVFHIRALKEIRALWRRSSRVPIMRRFYRFGSMNLLISAGTSVAYFSSLALLIMGATAKPDSMSRSTTYFDTVVFLTFFILGGRYLEAYSKSKTGNAVAMLGKLRPQEAILVAATPKIMLPEVNDVKENQLNVHDSSNVNIRVDTDLLEIGDVVVVPQGSSPPSDGEIAMGCSIFDESSLTGESRAVAKAPGDKVYAGTINVGKPIEVKITDLGGTSMLDQIISVVREGQTKRAPVERVVDSVTGYFVPIITALAILTFLIWFALGQSGVLPREYLSAQQGGWVFWSLEFAIAVFVVSCPCGIGLAAPTALFVGIGLAAKHGILVRGGGEAFQEASNVDIVVFDKTGTLTEGGNLKATDHEMLAEGEEADVAWTVTRRLEENSSHPIARAILDLSSAHSSLHIQSSSITEEAGLGLRGIFDITMSSSETETYEAALGSESLISFLDPPPSNFPNYFVTNLLSLWKSQSKSVALLAVRRLPSLSSPNPTSNPWKLMTLFAITDPIRPSAQPTITALLARGIGVYMLTGDNATTAAAVATSLSIPLSNVFAGVLPAEKASKIKHLQKHGPRRKRSRPSHFLSSVLTHRWFQSRYPSTPQTRPTVVAFIGDGINDAPALTAASVSISLSSASDIALSASHFILLGSSLESVLTLLHLSVRVFRRVKLNFAWAVAYNALLVPVAAGVLFRVREGGWRLGPVWGSVAMALSSLSVVGSSLALRWGSGRKGVRVE